MRIEDLGLPGAKLIVPTYFEDPRGYSAEVFNADILKMNGIMEDFIMDYESFNRVEGTIRGIHFQNAPYAQTKLVRVLTGRIKDYIIDLCQESSFYKKWVCVEISAKNREQIYIPKGYGHAFVTCEPNTTILYKLDGYYNASAAKAVRWDDPEIGINWEVDNPVLSERDAHAPWLSECDLIFDGVGD